MRRSRECASSTLYAYARYRGDRPEDAEDLIQGVSDLSPPNEGGSMAFRLASLALFAFQRGRYRPAEERNPLGTEAFTSFMLPVAQSLIPTNTDA